jgi:histidyl-tRNA synthetase
MTKKENPKEKSYLETVSDKVGEIAVHYGFAVIKPPHITNEDISKAKQFRDFDHYGDAEEKVALTRWYIDDRMDLESQPLSIHYKKPLTGSANRKKPGVEMYGFEIMGSNRTTSEALLIKCALAVLSELGYSDLYVDVNSIGDRESIGKFERELQAHFRKNSNMMPAKARQDWKKNHYSVLKNITADLKEFMKNAPQPVGSLSESGRIHFKEVLEAIEAFDVAYKIQPGIFSNKLYASYTVFEIRKMKEKDNMMDDGELLAYGYRYNNLAKKLGGKRDIPSMGMTILVKRNPKAAKKVLVKNIRKPHFYLVQLGPSAKLKALNIVEMLRKNKIPVYHSITKDKITGQLNGAEYMKATHVLIMGQKEALENSVVVRNVATREQDTVPIDRLADYLKNIEKPVSPKKGRK